MKLGYWKWIGDCIRKYIKDREFIGFIFCGFLASIALCICILLSLYFLPLLFLAPFVWVLIFTYGIYYGRLE